MSKLKEKAERLETRRKLRHKGHSLGFLGAILAAALALFFFAGSADPSEIPGDAPVNQTITSEVSASDVDI